jgi:ADP-ribose pyrophosphatase YjhB (NUDIX family)
MMDVKIELVIVAGNAAPGLTRCDPVVLMDEQGGPPCLRLPSGSPEAFAQRLAVHNSGVREPHVELIGAVDNTGGGITLTYLATVPGVVLFEGETLVPLREAASRIPVVDDALERLSRDSQVSDIMLSLLPGTFTLNQLMSLYEEVWGEKLDKRNFRRKMIEGSPSLEPAGVYTGREMPGRPPKLYRATRSWRLVRPPSAHALAVSR